MSKAFNAACLMAFAVIGCVQQPATPLSAYSLFKEAAPLQRPLARFNVPLVVHLGDAPNGAKEAIAKVMAITTTLTGLPVVYTDDIKRANFKFTYSHIGPASRTCVTETHSRVGVMIDATVNLGVTRYDCIAHEVMHALGFKGHPHEHDSVLSYTQNRTDFTELDRIIIKALYFGVKQMTSRDQILADAWSYIAKEVK